MQPLSALAAPHPDPLPVRTGRGREEARRCSAECSASASTTPRQSAPKGAAGLGPSAHVDTFARDNLPPAEQWPDLLLDRPEFQYPEYLNAAVELTDRMVEKGFGDNTALIGNGRRRTYKELADWSNRLAHALVEDFGVKPGNRVLIRSGNNPAMVAAWLAVTKAGAVAVNTMPMLRAGELTKIVDKAEVAWRSATAASPTSWWRAPRTAAS